jgi:hypothetical protein
MHTDAQVRKAGGRLSREDQRRILCDTTKSDAVATSLREAVKLCLGEAHKSQELPHVRRYSTPPPAPTQHSRHHCMATLGLAALPRENRRKAWARRALFARRAGECRRLSG